jgi:hypothetical protein
MGPIADGLRDPSRFLSAHALRGLAFYDIEPVIMGISTIRPGLFTISLPIALPNGGE